MFHLRSIKINVKVLIFELQKSTNNALVLKIVEIVIFVLLKLSNKTWKCLVSWTILPVTVSRKKQKLCPLTKTTQSYRNTKKSWLLYTCDVYLYVRLNKIPPGRLCFWFQGLLFSPKNANCFLEPPPPSPSFSYNHTKLQSTPMSWVITFVSISQNI